MKRLSLYLFLLLFTLQAPSWADDISDFQIEGMSVGDSALDYFSEEEIKNGTQDHYINKKFTPVQNDNYQFFKTFDAIDFNYKTNDKKYRMVMIAGIIIYENKIEDCYKKHKEIVEDLSTIFKNTETSRSEKIYDDEIWKGTKSTQFTFWFKNGDIVSVHCNDYSEKHGGQDHLAVNLKKGEFDKWLGIAY